MHAGGDAGEQALDQSRMLVAVTILVIVRVMAGCLFLIFVAGGRVRPVAMIRLRHLLLASAITDETPLQTKHLRTRHSQHGQGGENAFGEQGHDSAKMMEAMFYSIFIFHGSATAWENEARQSGHAPVVQRKNPARWNAGRGWLMV